MNKRGKSVDSTYLSLDMAEERGFIHRDYIAHCLRWSHVIKRLAERKAYATAHLLDVGCGRELPLAKTLYSTRYIVQQYYGVDVGPIKDEAIAHFDSGKFPIRCWENTDLLSLEPSDFDSPPNWITMFEVAEHVEPHHLGMMLRRIRSLASPEASLFLSTPCWNRQDCADNHVNEMTYEAFGSIIEGCGWEIRGMHGTFASIRDYQDELLKWPGGNLQPLFDSLRDYYDTNFLSCIFAPLFPHKSRNVLWEVTPAKKKYARVFKDLKDCEKPWGSSNNQESWNELLSTFAK